jgi:hypothetical protein
MESETNEQIRTLGRNQLVFPFIVVTDVGRLYHSLYSCADKGTLLAIENRNCRARRFRERCVMMAHGARNERC